MKITRTHRTDDTGPGTDGSLVDEAELQATYDAIEAGGSKSRANGTTSTSTPTPNCDTTDVYTLSLLATNATFGAPTGTPADLQKLLIRILGDGTVRTLAWNSGTGGYANGGTAMPTATVANKIIHVGFIYNSTRTKWMCVGSQVEP